MKNEIAKWGIYYMPNREGKLFAGLKPVLQATFQTQDEAIDALPSFCYLDELHSGYSIKPIYNTGA
jgi:hypothetical protein